MPNFSVLFKQCATYTVYYLYEFRFILSSLSFHLACCHATRFCRRLGLLRKSRTKFRTQNIRKKSILWDAMPSEKQRKWKIVIIRQMMHFCADFSCDFFLFIPDISECLKITQKVSFNIASEATFRFWVDQTLLNFWPVKQCYQKGQKLGEIRMFESFENEIFFVKLIHCFSRWR